jgi:glutamate formiminotransferase / 5-formyltetrahydrofolate cyclo-ligase
MKLFECVPNVSEGRDRATIEECAQAIVATGATLAHQTSDAAHHRSVFTYFGDAETVVAAAVALARVTSARIDLRAHRGEHPRIGALDVLPVVALGTATRDDAVAVARTAAARIWEAARVPSFFYGDAALCAAHRALPAVRRGGFEGLAARFAAGDGPDVGTIGAHESAGAIAVGARGVLVAFNVVLESGDVGIARAIARRIRASSGGLRTLRAIGVRLGPARVQVSCNVTEPDALPLDRVVALVHRAAARAGVAVEGAELIGLAPRRALAWVAARRLGVDDPALLGADENEALTAR